MEELLQEIEALEEGRVIVADGEKFVAIATKMSPDEYKRFCAITEAEGASKYAILQYLLSAYIRLKDTTTPITDELQQAAVLFGMETRFVERYTLANPTVEPEVKSAVYLFGSKESGKGKGSSVSGTIPVYVNKQPAIDEPMMTENVQEIFDLVLRSVNPVMWKKMDREARRRGMQSVYQLLSAWVVENDGIEDTEEIERMFGDNERGDFGQKPNDRRFTRTMRNAGETAARYEQTELAFEG